MSGGAHLIGQPPEGAKGADRDYAKGDEQDLEEATHRVGLRAGWGGRFRGSIP